MKQLLNKEKAEEAERTLQKWKDRNENPFPDFSADRIAEMRGTLPYPSNGAPSIEHAPGQSQFQKRL